MRSRSKPTQHALTTPANLANLLPGHSKYAEAMEIKREAFVQNIRLYSAEHERETDLGGQPGGIALAV